MVVRRIDIDGKTIGPGNPCYLIAEVGTTCLGDLNMALQLVKAGADAGVDAIKFQVIEPDQLSDKTVTYEVKTKDGSERLNMHEMFSQLIFSEAQWRQIAQACKMAGVHFFATVDYINGVDLLDQIGVSIHKMGAWDCTYRPLVEHIGKTGKPMFFDLGPATQEEIEDVIEWYMEAGGSAILFMHDFHTDVDSEMNLEAIKYINDHYPWPAGFSAPGMDDALDFAALAMGAHHIEKRLILDRSLKAFHAHESKEPEELKDWVAQMRHVERALGHAEIVPSKRDRAMSSQYYRSVCATRDIEAGEILSPENLDGKRPGDGISCKFLPDILGKKAKTNIKADQLISWEDVS